MENDYILEMHDVVKVFPSVRALDGGNLLGLQYQIGNVNTMGILAIMIIL